VIRRPRHRSALGRGDAIHGAPAFEACPVAGESDDHLQERRLGQQDVARRHQGAHQKIESLRQTWSDVPAEVPAHERSGGARSSALRRAAS
jgi:hypothetical protein